MSDSSSRSSQLSVPRKVLFGAVVALVATALILVLVELSLLALNVGYSPHLAMKSTGPAGQPVWRDNRWATAPYFSPDLVRRPLPFRLPAKKAPGTYRIFFLGSSAAMGDPEPSFSVARVLETLLRSTYPEQRFEVVNVAITAINSHLVAGIAKDCARLEPDLFVVYEGHNEVIGPFGPAGVFAPFHSRRWAVRTARWVQGTRTAQLVGHLGRSSSKSTAPREWGGMQMFLQQQIAADDPRLRIVRDLFEGNLRSIADSAHAAGAATLLCTVLTNQRDFAPFLSLHRAGLSSTELMAWQVAFDQAEQLARENHLPESEQHYRAALAIDNRHAELNFRLGRLALQQGRDTEAQAFLQRALDLDALRFRTDSTLNETIRLMGRDAAGLFEVVDAAAAVAARSAHGIAGDELLYEHVHLTLRGAYEVALELLPRVVADLQRRGLGANAAPTTTLAYGDVRLRLGYTAHEQAMIALELLKRFRAPPFTGQSDQAARVAQWERRVEASTKLLARADALPALRAIYASALAISPDDWIIARNAGSMLVARGEPKEALPWLEQAAAWIDDDVDTLVALGWAQQAAGQQAAALKTFARARALEPRSPGIPEFVKAAP